MGAIMEISGLINGMLSEMTKSEYKVAIFCLNNARAIAFDTLEETAMKIQTSTTSVIRFCRRLGFAGYKELQDRVRLELKMQPSLPDKYERAVSDTSEDLLTDRICRATAYCVEKTFSSISPDLLAKAVEKIASARRVFTFGMRESLALSHYAYTRLLSVRRDVNMLSAAYNGESEALLSLTGDDVCIVFLFHRYTSAALRVLEIIKECGAAVILVSAPPYDKALTEGCLLLSCHTDISGIKNSFVAPSAIADYLCNATALALGDEAVEYMRESEKIFDRLSLLED